MRSILPAVAVILGSAIAQAADTPQPAPSNLTVSVYNNNLALVQDIRRMDIARGRSRIEFKDVSASIMPETVSLTAPGLGVVEQNFDYDLLTPAKMMEKAVGHDIQVVRTNPATGAETTETATVLSVNDGVVLRIGDRIEVLRADGIPTQVVFSSIPENLRAQPTLSATVSSESDGPREVNLSYLTTGLKWKADYVAMYNEKQGTMRLQGWVTLTNASGSTYRDAQVRLIAGEINLTTASNYYQPRRSTPLAGGTGDPADPTFTDYYLYRLPEPVTIAQNQTKQVAFLDMNDVATKKTYSYDVSYFESTAYVRHVDVSLAFSNRAAPLPAGVARVYIRDLDGTPKFMGEDSFDHTPAGSLLMVRFGQAFDVTVQPTVSQTSRLSKTRKRVAMSYLFRNAGGSPVTVDMTQGGLGDDGVVVHESLKGRRIDAHRLGWSVPVPAHGETTLSFTIETTG